MPLSEASIRRLGSHADILAESRIVALAGNAVPFETVARDRIEDTKTGLENCREAFG